MATAKKYPEFELPTKLLDTIKDYLGTAKMAKMSAAQRSSIAALVTKLSEGVGRIIDFDPKEPIVITEADRPD